MRKLQLSSLFGELLRDPYGPAMSPDPETGGRVPLPSFGPNGEYIPPTGSPFNPRMPRNTLDPGKGISPEELRKLLEKVRQGPRPPSKITF